MSERSGLETDEIATGRDSSPSSEATVSPRTSSPRKRSPDAHRSVLQTGPLFNPRAIKPKFKSDADEGVDETVFEDERKASEYFKGLISYTDLRVAWSGVLKRMRDLEERCYSGASGDATGAKLDNAFVTRKDCREITRDIYAQVLEDQGLHLDRLEDRAEKTIAKFKVHASDIEGIRAKLKSQDRAIENRKTEIAAAMEQDKVNHETILAAHQKHEAEIVHEHAYFQALCDGLKRKAEDEERARLDLESRHKKLHALIHDKGLHETIRKICKEVLEDYISWDTFRVEARKIHQRAVDAITPPLSDDIAKLAAKTTALIQELRGQDAEIRKALQEVSDRVTVTDTKFTDKTSDMLDEMKEFAKYDMVKAMEDQMNERHHHNEDDFLEFKCASTETLDSHLSRLNTLKSMLEDHEHCLRHHAEEILNRSTKYDIVICQQKLDQCALKDKVEADLDALSKTVTWQSVRLEEVVFRANFGEVKDDLSGQQQGQQDVSQADAHSISDMWLASTGTVDAGDMGKASGSLASTDASGKTVSPGSQAKAQTLTAEPHSPASARSAKFASEPGRSGSNRPAALPSHDHHHDTELFAVLQSQLESLAHCLLGTAHSAFRELHHHPGASHGHGMGCSREERVAREHELLFHISNLVHWVTHRRAPNDWDPTRLTSLALKCMLADKSKPRSYHHQPPEKPEKPAVGTGHEYTFGSVSHHSQELGSTCSWGTSDAVSTESIGFNKSGSIGHQEKNFRDLRGSRQTSPASRRWSSLAKALNEKGTERYSIPWGIKPGHEGALFHSPSSVPQSKRSTMQGRSSRMILSPPGIVKGSHHGIIAEEDAGDGEQRRKLGTLQSPQPTHLRELVVGGHEAPPNKQPRSARGSTCAPPSGSSLLKRPASLRTNLVSTDPAAGGKEIADLELEIKSPRTSPLPPLSSAQAAEPDDAIGDNPSE